MSGDERTVPARPRRARPGQALIELVLVLPLLLFLAFAVVGAGRVLQARQGVDAVAREAARAAARDGGATAAPWAGIERGQEVARGYGLTNSSLRVVVTADRFAPGGTVTSTASYDVRFDDLPLLGWARVRVQGEAREAIALYSSVQDGATCGAAAGLIHGREARP